MPIGIAKDGDRIAGGGYVAHKLTGSDGIPSFAAERRASESTVNIYDMHGMIAHDHGRVSRLRALLLTNPAALQIADYNKRDFSEFSAQVGAASALMRTGGEGTIDLHGIRYGAGANMLLNLKEGRFLLLVQRSDDAPREPGKLDIPAGLGNYMLPCNTAMAEAAEEISVWLSGRAIALANATREVAITNGPTVLIPNFTGTDSKYNNIAEDSAKAALGQIRREHSYTPVDATVVQLRNPTQVSVSGFPPTGMNIGFEQRSVEMVLGVISINLPMVSIDDLSFLDTECTKGVYHHRRTVAVDLSNGQFRIYRDGGLVGVQLGDEYMKEVMKRVPLGFTVKLHQIAYSWPDDQLGDITQLTRLGRGM